MTILDVERQPGMEKLAQSATVGGKWRRNTDVEGLQEGHPDLPTTTSTTTTISMECHE